MLLSARSLNCCFKPILREMFLIRRSFFQFIDRNMAVWSYITFVGFLSNVGINKKCSRGVLGFYISSVNFFSFSVACPVSHCCHAHLLIFDWDLLSKVTLTSLSFLSNQYSSDASFCFAHPYSQQSIL